MKTFTRINITIPVEVRAGIDACPERVNWSAVAAEAFRRRLAELDASRCHKARVAPESLTPATVDCC